MTTNPDTEQCPRCKGLGSLQKMPCPYCDRKGVVPKGEADRIRRRMIGSGSRGVDMYVRRG